jgi:hypothetical protein
MYFPATTLIKRRQAIALINSGLTLIILLIAPLGLAAVLVNTLLVGLASYYTCTIADRLWGQRLTSPIDPQLDPLAELERLSNRPGPLDRS